MYKLGTLRPYPQTPKRTVPLTIGRPDYADHAEGYPLSEQSIRGSSQIKALNDEEKEAMRVVSKVSIFNTILIVLIWKIKSDKIISLIYSQLGREILEEASNAVAVGVTTDEIDRIVHEACVIRECYPSPLNYYEFPKSCCTSINEVICHGIPDLRPLKDGDICNSNHHIVQFGRVCSIP